jgi:hypothetical protein
VLAGEVDDQLTEHVDDDVVEPRERVLEERDALLDGERRLLVVRVPDDTHDDPVERRRCAADDVDVAERHRVEGPGVDCDDGRAVGHGAKRVRRAEP